MSEAYTPKYKSPEFKEMIKESLKEMSESSGIDKKEIVSAITGVQFVEIPEILKDPQLLDKIDLELDKKVVGEHESRKTIFMVANMRNVENLSKATDNLMVNAPSGTGKDHLCEAIFDLIPEEEKEELIRTTPKVLAYTRNRKLIKEGKNE